MPSKNIWNLVVVAVVNQELKHERQGIGTGEKDRMTENCGFDGACKIEIPIDDVTLTPIISSPSLSQSESPSQSTSVNA